MTTSLSLYDEFGNSLYKRGAGTLCFVFQCRGCLYSDASHSAVTQHIIDAHSITKVPGLDALMARYSATKYEGYDHELYVLWNGTAFTQPKSQ